MLSKKQTKELSLRLWGYLKKNPTLYKESVSPELLKEVKDFCNFSPLCGYFCEDDCKSADGELCPSRPICSNKNEIKYHHYVVGDLKARTRVINAIYDLIAKWSVE